MHGLVVKWNRELNNLDVISGARIYEKSVAAHVLTLMVDVPSAHLIRAVFSSYDAESETYKELTEPLNMMEAGVGQYELPIPDLVLDTAGERLITFMDYEPIVQGTETVYQVVTSGTVRIMVGANNAVLGQTPVPQTVADRLQEQINIVGSRISRWEASNLGKVMVDFKITDYGTIIKYYSDMSSAEFPLRVNETPRTEDFFTVLTIDGATWQYDLIETRYFVAFPATSTGYTNDRYMAFIDHAGEESYSTNLTSRTELTGHYSIADSVFKGSDGSLLITSNEPYTGRVLLLSGKIHAISAIEYQKETTNYDKIVFTFNTGEKQTITLPFASQSQVNSIQNEVNQLLDIHDSLTHFRGWFSSDSELPTDDIANGDYAWVGNYVYVYYDGSWEDSGEEVPGADLGAIQTDVNTLKSQMATSTSMNNAQNTRITTVENKATNLESRVGLLEQAGSGGGGKLYLHKIPIWDMMDNGVGYFITCDYISSRATPYSYGTEVDIDVPYFFEQQKGKVYDAYDDKWNKNWICAFSNEFYSMINLYDFVDRDSVYGDIHHAIVSSSNYSVIEL